MHRLAICAVLFIFVDCAAFAREASPFRAGTQPDGKKGAGEPANRAKIIDEIRTDLDSAVDKLNRQDPSRQTRAVQDRILENLKKLIEPDDDSPPPPSNSSNPPPKPMNPPPSSQDPPPESKPQPQNNEPPAPNSKPESKPQPQNMQSQAKPKAASTNPSERLSPPPRSLEDPKKQNRNEDGVWHPDMPWRHRKAMDATSSERFVRRYEEVLREYYRALAENTKRE